MIYIQMNKSISIVAPAAPSWMLGFLVVVGPTEAVLPNNFRTSVAQCLLTKTTMEVVFASTCTSCLVPIFACPESMDFRSRFGNIEDDIHLLSAKAFG